MPQSQKSLHVSINIKHIVQTSKEGDFKLLSSAVKENA